MKLCACFLPPDLYSQNKPRGSGSGLCVCVHACLSVCTHLLDNTVQGVHAKLSLSFVCVYVILFISVSVSQPVHLILLPICLLGDYTGDIVQVFECTSEFTLLK